MLGLPAADGAHQTLGPPLERKDFFRGRGRGLAFIGRASASVRTHQTLNQDAEMPPFDHSAICPRARWRPRPKRPTYLNLSSPHVTGLALPRFRSVAAVWDSRSSQSS